MFAVQFCVLFWACVRAVLHNGKLMMGEGEREKQTLYSVCANAEMCLPDLRNQILVQ